MTILFLEDWKYYPEAIVDTETKNKSFLRLSALYREMGIQNHAFLLQLHNRSLQGVDPFDPELPIETMMAISVECKRNPFYYFREIARDPKGASTHPLMFGANRANMAVIWLFLNHIMVINIQPRQTGKSFSIDLLQVGNLNIFCTDTHINLFTKDIGIRAKNLDRLKSIESSLPFYLKMRENNEVSNTEEIKIGKLRNTYRGHVPNKSPKDALNVGRGYTASISHIDEAAFFHNIGISLPAALSAGHAARDIAKIKNEPYGTIITTTAGKKDDRDGKYIYNMLNNAAIWTEKFFDCANLEDLEKTVRRNAAKGELRVNCTFNHRQLGKTDEWLKAAIEESNSEGEDAERDYLNRWTSGSISSPLPVELNNKIRDSLQVDFFNEIGRSYGYITRWFIPENQIASRMASSCYIMGLDSSDAAGGDDIGMSVRDVKTGEVIAAGTYNETNLITFSEWLCQWFIRFPTFTLIIERRSTGAMILDYLLLMLPNKNIDPFTRIYNKAIQEADEYPDRFKEVTKPMFARSSDVYVKYKKLFGFATSATGATSRAELYSNTLINAAKITGDTVRDPKTIDQILGLVIRNGRVDHEEGNNDDLCIAWLLSFWLMTRGKHLTSYGISSRDILCNNTVNKEENSPTNIYNARMREFARQKIESLIEEIKVERDDYVVMNLENQLKLAYNNLSETDRMTLSIDELISNLRENRRINRRQSYNNYRYR